MTEADKHFIETCKRIIKEGYSSEGTRVRTRWEDGETANYISLVGVTNVYDVGKEFMVAANGWNTMQYVALLCMFAQVAGLEVGTLTHNIGDCHIYDRHVPLIEKLIEAESMDVHPKLVIKNPTKNFYDFKVEDFEIEGYDYNKDIKLGKIPVAI